jgi:phospholipid N-methyltransferase
MATEPQVTKQIKYFEAENKWKGGYFEGDPLDPMASSSYSILGYMSILHATYLACIKPYVHSDTRVLEIGPGRGAWTRTMLNAQEIVCCDALSAEHNKFWEYVGRAPNVTYNQVSDFTLSFLPDDHFTYFFSFGVFCHISPQGTNEYFKSIFKKLASGSHGFVMVADRDKLRAALSHQDRLSSFRTMHKRRFLPALAMWKAIYKLRPSQELRELKEFENPEDFQKVGFFYLGADRACDMLTEAGFRVLDRDVGTVYRDAVVHFVKP